MLVSRILLLGAGFSRNWGGWLASEFIGELCGHVIARPQIGHTLRVLRNFEQALEEKRGHANYERRRLAPRAFPNAVGDSEDEINKISEAIMPQPIGDVLWLERAIRLTFRDMNTIFANLQGLSLSGDPGDNSVDKFLAAFDAIFTLNQDLLLECQYRPTKPAKPSKPCLFPGVPSLDPSSRARWLDTLAIGDTFDLPIDHQPIFKLHGSVNWRDSRSNDVLIIGTGKEDAIDGNPLLKKYHKCFREYLFAGRTQVMVIGYSFSDPHINEPVFETAKQHNLQMYLVDPAGLNAFRALPEFAQERNTLVENIPLIGISTRPLTATFGQHEDP